MENTWTSLPQGVVHFANENGFKKCLNGIFKKVLHTVVHGDAFERIKYIGVF
jgi:hypothetical protein